MKLLHLSKTSDRKIKLQLIELQRIADVARVCELFFCTMIGSVQSYKLLPVNAVNQVNNNQVITKVEELSHSCW